MEWVKEQLNTQQVALVIVGLKPSRPMSANMRQTRTVCATTPTGNVDCWSKAVANA